MSKRNDYLKAAVIQYATSVLQLVDGIKSNNISQVVSLIKANIRVLENDVKNSFSKHETQDIGYRDYN
mgnify:CR=1 FL=1